MLRPVANEHCRSTSAGRRWHAHCRRCRRAPGLHRHRGRRAHGPCRASRHVRLAFPILCCRRYALSISPGRSASHSSSGDFRRIPRPSGCGPLASASSSGYSMGSAASTREGAVRIDQSFDVDTRRQAATSGEVDDASSPNGIPGRLQFRSSGEPSLGLKNSDGRPSVSLTIPQPRSWLSPLVLLLFLPAFLLHAGPLGTASAHQLMGLGLYVLFIGAVAWLKFVAGTRRVELLPREGMVRITWRNALFRPKRREHPLDLFGAVVSYVVPGRFPTTRVELLDRSRTRALPLASFATRCVAPNFWSIPRDRESDAARDVRISVARATGLEDGGFLGSRWPGAQLP